MGSMGVAGLQMGPKSPDDASLSAKWSPASRVSSRNASMFLASQRWPMAVHL